MSNKKMFSFMFDKELKAKLVEEAKSQERTVSFLINNSVKLYLAVLNKNKKVENNIKEFN